MKLLITIITMIFISFNSFGIVKYQVENLEEQQCYTALHFGEVLSHDVKEGVFTVKWLMAIYSFMGGFTGDSFMISNCQKTKYN